MSTPIYSNTNHSHNITMYWQQYFPKYKIPTGYHVHHLKPKWLCKYEEWTDEQINHPRNLIVLHPDDHASIHKCRGDIKIGNMLISNGLNFVSYVKNKRLSNINEDGLNSYQQASEKMLNTRLNDIDVNGLNSYQRASIKMHNTKSIVSDNGLNIYQNSQIKAQYTKDHTVTKSGLTIQEEATLKRYNTFLNQNKNIFPDLYNKNKFTKKYYINGRCLISKCMNDYNISRYRVLCIKKFHNI